MVRKNRREALRGKPLVAPPPVPPHLGQGAFEIEVLHRIEAFAKRELLMDEADPGPSCGKRRKVLPRNGPARDGDRSVIGTEDPGEDAHERALARAIGPHQAHDLPAPEGETHPVAGKGRAETLAHSGKRQEGRRLACPLPGFGLHRQRNAAHLARSPLAPRLSRDGGGSCAPIPRYRSGLRWFRASCRHTGRGCPGLPRRPA